ncbi:Uma2 family endonuclease [Paludisphaera rhizosphaerae]|uniref:Uma2 family endonuclease n=1 Tax=Paludisphaera rhizosphaerae TaxID=2711216 RepID=UPI0013EC2E59|nr:Uma2 family endonuclease [Paludisphaera rhizosphaerae]
MSTVAKPTQSTIPPLENGDRLTRAEFERRYEAMAGVRAELIEGAVHMPSPVHAARHAEPHAHLIGLLFNYKIATSGVRLFTDSSVRLDLDNEPQPDASLTIDPRCGGQSKLSQDDYIEGAPELVAEVSSSTVSIDLGSKLNAYRRNGVLEYLVWRVRDRAFDWFILREGSYVPLVPDADGLLKSQTFPGLWLDPEAMLADDLPRVIAALNRGLASPEHAAFVQRLQEGGG